MKNEDNILKLIKRYGNEEEALKNEPSLDNLYAFSPHINGLFEWIENKSDESVLLSLPFNLSIIKLLKYRRADVDIYIKEKNELYDFVSEEFNCNLVYDLKNVNKLYDKIIVDCGCGDENNLSVIYDKYKCLLKENGYIILAFDNYYGFKYSAGAKTNGFAYTYSEVSDFCDYIYDKYGKEVNIYFPFPDYKVPVNIYSKRYLPSKGELSFDVPAYNYPHMGEKSLGVNIDRAVQKGDYPKFANSYLLVIGKKLDEVYIKYNRNRFEKYRIKTVIYQKNNELYVEKSSIDNTDAGVHLNALLSNYERLIKENKNISYVKPELNEDKIGFKYIKGNTLSKYLEEKYLSADIIDYQKLYDEINKITDYIIPENGSFNFDATFDNFILSYKGEEIIDFTSYDLIGIDYEWIGDEPYDKAFLKYRILDLFYEKFLKQRNLDREEYFKSFNINESERKLFRNRELNIQHKINGDIQKIFLDNYFVDYKTYGDYENIKDDNSSFIYSEGKNGDLTQQHIDNLENMVITLRKDIVNLQNIIEANKNNEKLREVSFNDFMNSKFNNICPVDSKKRKIFRYLKIALKNPKRMYKILRDDNERNRMLGDFFIGDCYLDKGRISVPYYKKPKVSIIIPVYNQINYTYCCIKSIIDTVKDIEYEVIVADDVSKDATKNISYYIDGVKHIRNKVNTGFVKNCNNGVSAAVGEYIVFLNNDTVVKEGWLSTLVDTLDNNSEIGMAGSKLLYPNNTLQEAGGIIWSDGSGWNYGRGDDPDKFEYNYLKEVDYISGASIIIRKSLFDDIGGFDERYAPAYCEDSDLAFEVRKRNYKVVYQPLSECIHFEGISNGTDVNGGGLKKYQIENTLKLKEKWKDEFANQCENTGLQGVFRARERSKNKKIIIFIDHYVPTFDKDAGSRTTFAYINMLIKKGYVVKFIGNDFRKEEPYSTILMQMGVEIFYGVDRKKEAFDIIKKYQNDIHIIYLNRPDIAAKYIDFIRENTDIKVVYYAHDLHFLREERQYKLTGDVNHKMLCEYYKKMEFDIMKKVDISYYPSDYEIKYLHGIDGNLNIKAINAFVYDEFKEKNKKSFKEREGILFVGGFAHQPNKDAVMWFVKDILPKVEGNCKFNFYIVGSKADEEIMSLHNEDQGIIVKGFIDDNELDKLYENVRLSVVPLRYGAGVKGKVIDALYNYVPVLTTSVGIEGIKGADDCISVEDDAYEYAKKLVQLYNDTDKLEHMSLCAQNYIKNKHSLDAVWNIVKDDFE